MGQRRAQWNGSSTRDRDNARFMSPNSSRRYGTEDRRTYYSAEDQSGHLANRVDDGTTLQPRRSARPQFTTCGRSMSSQPAYGIVCNNCGRSHSFGNCAALNLTCYRCQRVGHVSRCRRSAPRPAERGNY